MYLRSKHCKLTQRTWSHRWQRHCWAWDVILHKSMNQFPGRFKWKGESLPAIEELVRATVWNHVGKVYIIVKLHMPTRKLLIPTRTGTFCFKRKGAKTGSKAKRISTRTNATANTQARIRGTMTETSLHCMRRSWFSQTDRSLTIQHSLSRHHCTLYSRIQVTIQPLQITFKFM